MPIYKIEFDIVSLIICCIAFIVFHKQKQMNTNRNTLFYTIIIFISLSAVFSLLNSLALNRLATSSVYFAYITNILYLAFHTHVPFLFCLYIFILTEYRLPNLAVRIIFALPWIAFLMLIFGNPFHHALFYKEPIPPRFFSPCIVLSYCYLYKHCTPCTLSQKKKTQYN
mgnify:CR=1 FL=1|jgi:hypothetical protein